jgi:hypothetical protein
VRAGSLHVVTAIANPIRWKSRIKLYTDFEQHMLDSGAKLTVVECTYGERDAELGQKPHVNYVRVRAAGVHKTWTPSTSRRSTPTFSSEAGPGQPTRSTRSSTTP